jgi:isoquinoline 1-oxidoreductase alpha subunit
VTLSQVEGKSVTTIEGLSEDGSHPVQQAWKEVDVPQCGYCQAGQIMTAAAFLEKNPSPDEMEIKDAMHGNICRCATYQRIYKAVEIAAGKMG